MVIRGRTIGSGWSEGKEECNFSLCIFKEFYNFIDAESSPLPSPSSQALKIADKHTGGKSFVVLSQWVVWFVFFGHTTTDGPLPKWASEVGTYVCLWAKQVASNIPGGETGKSERPSRICHDSELSVEN